MPYEINLDCLNRLTDSDAMTQIGLNNAVGVGTLAFLKAHIYRLDLDRANTLGGERFHYYKRAAEGVTMDSDQDGAYLTIHQIGYRQHLLGGTIYAKNVKNLTIPAIAEAYGHAASEFNLIFAFGIFRATGLKALAEKAPPHRVFYWLKSSVYQAPDPTVLPETDALKQAALTAARNYLTNLTK